MSEKDIAFLIGLKKTLWQVSATIITAVILASVAFYFNTSKDIEYLKENQSKKADKAVYEMAIKEINNDIGEIKQDLKDIKNNGK